MPVITVALKKGKNAQQPYTFTIDDPSPGPKLTVRERYTDAKAAKRGALRKLGIWKGRVSGTHSLKRGNRTYTVTFKTA